MVYVIVMLEKLSLEFGHIYVGWALGLACLA
jgi:hypothetical protein